MQLINQALARYVSFFRTNDGQFDDPLVFL